jgi:MoaA/NifB/PqqE/SkfB family radical SAM enzyme
MKNKNFAWIATWKITRRCNLYCVYCDHPTMLKATEKETVDYAAIIDTLEKYKPKILNISGGEPTLVPQLSSILADIKQRWNPYIRIVHNGTAPDKLIPCLPYIDRLVISLDGPDPINSKNRGISAASVLAKLLPILPECAKHSVEVAINCVVTTTNVPHLYEFAQLLRSISPEIILSFAPLMPPDDMLSIMRAESLYTDFLATFNRLRQEGFRVIHVFDPLIRHPDYKHIQCYNQYFVVRVLTGGQVTTCAMNTDINGSLAAYYAKKLFSANGIAKAVNRITKVARSRIAHQVDFSCNTLCTCEGWLDLLFLGIESHCIAHYAKALRNRMTDSDYADVEAFVRKNINPSFSSAALKQAIGADTGAEVS